MNREKVTKNKEFENKIIIQVLVPIISSIISGCIVYWVFYIIDFWNDMDIKNKMQPRNCDKYFCHITYLCMYGLL